MLLVGCGRGGSMSSIKLTPSALSLNVNQSTQMHLLLDEMGQETRDVTASAQWIASSADGSVHDGVVTCQHLGTFSVQASLGALTTEATIVCAPLPTLTHIRFADIPGIIRSETPYAFRLVGVYSDGTTTDMSNAATWTAKTPAVYVTDTGDAFCNTSGSATIEATLGSQVADATFDCILKRITPVAGFTEAAQEFYGPFPSWVDIKARFGAKGDGVTDDTEAFQHALDSLIAQPAVLWIPRGKYVITQSLHLQSGGSFSIIGEDPGNTSIVWKGSSGGTMLDIEGCNWFRLARLSWDGMNVAAIAINIGSTLSNGERYPTFDAIQDQRISNVGVGLQVGFAGETSIQRVHFDRNTVAGISLKDFNALNFNVIDSLFTDCNIGVTNWYGAGAFNVSNSIFVRSQTADMKMGNTGPFSERQNISIDSNAFFVAGPIGAAATIILQANTIIRPKTNPIQIGNPGPIMVIDNDFLHMDSSLHLVVGVGVRPLSVFSLGNTFMASQPFAGNLEHVSSIDETTSSSESSEMPTIPAEVYTPPHSQRPVYEIPSGSTVDAIQQQITAAVLISGGAVLHFPRGTFALTRTLEIPDAAKVAIIGDGPVSALVGTTSLTGPIMRVLGTNVDLENLRFMSYGTGNTAIEINVDDVPSTIVQCNQCKTNSTNGFVSSGIDSANIEFRIATLNASSLGASIGGGMARLAGTKTLGRVDAFLTGIDAYDVKDNAHFLVADGWHDAGQGPVQFDLKGAGQLTQQGGAIYTSSTTGMTMSRFSGEISLLGIATDSVLRIDNGVNTRAMVAASVQIDGKDLVNANDSSAIVGEISNYALLSNGAPVLRPDVASSPSWIEHMFAQARTEYPIPNLPLAAPRTQIEMDRLTIDHVEIGIEVLPTQKSPSAGIYTISAPLDASQSIGEACSTDEVSMNGEWSMQGDMDGFYGLKRQSSFLSSLMTTSVGSQAVGASDRISDARQRWIIWPIGNGLFEIVNRATGYLLTRTQDGCADLSPRSGSSGQEWVVNALRASSGI